MVRITNCLQLNLADNIRELGFDMVRFKTGTPPRVNSKTIDYSKTEIQPGMMYHEHSVLKQLNSLWINFLAG